MPVWADGEEFINSFTHGIGILFAIVGLHYLYQSGKKSNNKQKLLGNIVFGVSMLILYSSSTIYHGLVNMKYKKFMRYVDHCSVYLLIAGSYTPFTLTTLKGRGGNIIFTCVWAIAIAGIVSKIFFFDTVEKFTALFYVLLGWFVIFGVKPLFQRMSKKGLLWLFMGGISYTVGALFFQMGRTIQYCHGIFHLFILGGSICHFICIMRYT